MTKTSLKAYRQKQKREQIAYLRSVGYESPIFTAKFNGGKCGQCAGTVRQYSEVAYFGAKLCHVPCINQAIYERDRCPTCKGTSLVITNGQVSHCPHFETTEQKCVT